MRSIKSILTFSIGLALTGSWLSAQSYPVRHPIYPAHASVELIASLKEETAAVMQLTPEKIDEWIVPRTTIYNIACPNCRGGTTQQYGWNWAENDPDHITCRYCGMVFPNAQYPLTKVTTVKDPTGTVQEYRYYEGQNGYKHYLRMRVENCKKQYMEHQAVNLARLFAATHDEAYARQSALILNRLADVYSHYNVHGIENWETTAPVIWEIAPKPVQPDGLQPVPGLAKDLEGYNWWPPLGKAAYPYCSTRRGDGMDNWFYSEIPTELVEAYDLVASSPELDKLSKTLNRDVRRNIEDFFRATANYVRTFPIYLGNMDPKLIGGLASVGRVIGEPEFVHDAWRRAKPLMGWQFYPDGMWREGSPGYHDQLIFWLRDELDATLKGYSDPEGYINSSDKRHLTDLDPIAELPMLPESIAALNRLRLPNGQYLSIHDTWAPVTLGRPVPAVKDEPFMTELFWGMGEALLGLGRGKTGVQADLHFSGGYGHAHYDNLDMVLFGEGRELLPDLGYTHTVLRPFAISSLAHNLVVVNECNQQLADGHLLGWGICGDSLRFCEAGDEGSYPGVVSVYRRALSVVTLPKPGAYVVDVFRVRGGCQHDWLIHGSADYPQTVACSLPLQTGGSSLLPSGVREDAAAVLAGALTARQALLRPQAPITRLYWLFDTVKTAKADGTWSLTFRYTEPDSAVLRTTVLGQQGTTVYCGTLPSVRPAHENNRSREILRSRMPTALARRQGENLASTFVAVHEPYEGTPQIASVERLELAEGGPDAVGIICRGDGFTDYHLCGTDAASRMRASSTQVSATGRYAFVRTRNGQVVHMVLIDGAEVRFGDRVLSASAPETGKVMGVRRIEAGDAEDALLVDASIPPHPGRVDERVIVEFGDGTTYALGVREIRRERLQSVIVLQHRPGFTLSADRQTATQSHHPHHIMAGQPRFRLPQTAEWPAEGNSTVD
jgi:hypothetical protein